MTSGHVGQVAYRRWLHIDASEGRFSGFDAAHVFVEPDEQVAQQHHVVTGIHGRVGRVAVPKLPDGGGIVLRHVAPAGVSRLSSHLVGQVNPSVGGQRAHEPLYTHYAGTDVTRIFTGNTAHQVVYHPLFSVVGYHIESQRQYIGRCGVVGILLRVGIPVVYLNAFLTKPARSANQARSVSLPRG